MQRTRKLQDTGHSNITSKLIKPMTVGFGVGITAILFLLIIFSIVLSIRDIPQQFITPLAVIAAALGAFFAAYTSGRIIRRKGMLLGFIQGICIFVVVFLAGLSIPGEGVGGLTIIKLIALCLSGVIGSVMGVNYHKKKK